MYPDWLTILFRHGGCNCTQCRGAIGVAEIRFIGVRRPDPQTIVRPQAFFLTRCPLCGHRTEYTVDASLEGISEAVEALFHDIEEGPPATDLPFTLPSMRAPPKPVDPTPEPVKSDAVRPSRRPNQPLTPPTDAEITQFLARLKKTSFKTNSKGFGKLAGPKRKPIEPDDIKGPGEDEP